MNMSIEKDQFLIYAKLDSRFPTSIDNIPRSLAENPTDFEIKLVGVYCDRPPQKAQRYYIFCNNVGSQLFFGGYQPILYSFLLSDGRVKGVDLPFVPLTAANVPLRALAFYVQPTTPDAQLCCVFHVRRRNALSKEVD